MAFCGKCGHEVRDEAAFCPNCGAERRAGMVPGAGAGATVPGAAGARIGSSLTKKPIMLIAIIAVAAAIVVSVIVFVIVPLLTNRPVVTPVNVIQEVVGEPESGNPRFSNIVRMDGSTYLLVSTPSQKMYQILKVDDDENAQSEEIYRLTYSEDSSSSLQWMFAYDHRLYFMISSYASSSGREPDLAWIDPSAKDPVEQRVGLMWSDGYTFPDSPGQEYDYAEYLDLDKPLTWLYPLQQIDQYLYLRQISQGDSEVTILPLFRIDLKLGTISAAEGGMPANLRWGPQLIYDGYVYYQKYQEWDPVGLYRAKLDKLSDEELLLKAPSLSEVPNPNEALYYQHQSMRFIVDGKLYYTRQRYDTQSERYETELHRLDLSSRDDELLPGEYAWSANVRGNDLYYFDEGDLRHVDLGNLEDTLLMRNYSSDNEYKSSLFLSGDWIYYYSDSEYFRVWPDETGFPTKGLA